MERKANPQGNSSHEREVVSCPTSPDRAEEMRAIGNTEGNETLFKVPVAKDKNASQRWVSGHIHGTGEKKKLDSVNNED